MDPAVQRESDRMVTVLSLADYRRIGTMAGVNKMPRAMRELRGVHLIGRSGQTRQPR